MRTGWLALLVLAAGLLTQAPASGARADADDRVVLELEDDATGRAFLDADGDGAFDPGEMPLPGVAVSNGVRRATTDARGRYRLDAGDGMLRITRPRGVDCTPWYRTTPGDFACRRVSDPDALLFVHVTDAHVFADPQDLAEYSLPEVPRWLPDFVVRRLLLLGARRYAPQLRRGEVLVALRAGLPPAQGQLADDRVLPGLLDEFLRPGSESGRVRAHVAHAFDELAALAPDFVVSTGDLVLEGNRATPEAARRWMRIYREEVARSGLPFFHGIGNNELVASARKDARRVFGDDPDLGKGLYRRHFGPTHYAFERGAFHFVVTDTHVPRGSEFSFFHLDPRQRRALAAELAAVRGRPVVVLNHEPFGWDPDAGTDTTLVQDEGLLAREGVAYAFSGHVHRNGVWHDGVTTHVSSGALSGMRWFLPAGFVERGMRLVWLQGERLFSAWKRLGEPCVGFVSPGQGPPLWPSGQERARPGEIVFVAVDRAGAFDTLSLWADGEAVPFERWGRYFGVVQRPPGAATLSLVARREDGSEERAELPLDGGAEGHR